jgi:hypothetical protein
LEWESLWGKGPSPSLEAAESVKVAEVGGEEVVPVAGDVVSAEGEEAGVDEEEEEVKMTRFVVEDGAEQLETEMD